jgi:hypothetical protein
MTYILRYHSWVWQLFAVFFCMLALAMPARAALHVMTITGVGVHEKIEVAQALAVEYAKKRAVYDMVSKWNVPQVMPKLSTIPADVMAQAIRGAEVLRVKREENVLYAEVKVTLQDIPIKRALKLPLMQSDATPKTRGILVLPVFKDGDRNQVWGRANILRDPVKRAALSYGKGAVVVPGGTPEDMALVDYDNVLTVRFDQLKPMLERYGATEAVVAVVTPVPPASKQPTHILLNRIMQSGIDPEMISLAPEKKEENEASRMKRAAESIARFAGTLAVSTSQSQRAALEKASHQTVILQFSTMQEFGTIDRVLRATKGVMEMVPEAMALQSVRAVIYYEGDLEKIRTRLVKKHIFVRDAGGTWVLSMR